MSNTEIKDGRKMPNRAKIMSHDLEFILSAFNMRPARKTSIFINYNLSRIHKIHTVFFNLIFDKKKVFEFDGKK